MYSERTQTLIDASTHYAQTYLSNADAKFELIASLASYQTVQIPVVQNLLTTYFENGEIEQGVELARKVDSLQIELEDDEFGEGVFSFGHMIMDMVWALQDDDNLKGLNGLLAIKRFPDGQQAEYIDFKKDLLQFMIKIAWRRTSKYNDYECGFASTDEFLMKLERWTHEMTEIAKYMTDPVDQFRLTQLLDTLSSTKRHC